MKILRPLAVLATLAVLAAYTWLWWSQRPMDLTLTFTPIVGDKPYQPGSGSYRAPEQAGQFSVRDFQMFISNIHLVADSGEFIEPESYHLLRFESGDFNIHLNDIPRHSYRSIAIGLGVDPKANGTLVLAGDLDPNGRMAWTWDVGYKFILFEGSLTQADRRVPLVYHIGFSENYRTLEFTLPARAGSELQFDVDLMALFTHRHSINQQTLPTVKFDREDARLLAENAAGLLRLKN
jgi:MbnP